MDDKAGCLVSVAVELVCGWCQRRRSMAAACMGFAPAAVCAVAATPTRVRLHLGLDWRNEAAEGGQCLVGPVVTHGLQDLLQLDVVAVAWR